MKLNKELTEPIVDWFDNNIKSIKKNNEEFLFNVPKGHKGFVLGIKDLDVKQRQELLEEKGFPLTSFLEIVDALREYYKIPKETKPSKMGWIISYAESGYLCKFHRDSNGSNETIHSRINVMISKPDIGGQALIVKPDGRNSYPNIIDVEENEPWLCLAGEYYHSTVEVKGDKPRIMISIGLETPRWILEKNNHIKPNENNSIKRKFR
tara:strand:+ start:1585 stop:2208 length:624 start_codon:yes stop_codon:yes gene_type:complete